MPSTWHGVGDPSVTLGLAENVGLWMVTKPGCLRGLGWRCGDGTLRPWQQQSFPVVPAGRIPSWKIFNFPALGWFFFSLCSAVCCGTKSTAKWCPHFSHCLFFFGCVSVQYSLTCIEEAVKVLRHNVKIYQIFFFHSNRNLCSNSVLVQSGPGFVESRAG